MYKVELTCLSRSHGVSYEARRGLCLRILPDKIPHFGLTLAWAQNPPPDAQLCASCRQVFLFLCSSILNSNHGDTRIS